MTWRAAARRDPASGGTATEHRQEPGPLDPRTGGSGEPTPDNAGWTIFSYLISGMVVYGLIGWLVATLTHMSLLIPVGALAGLVIAIGGIIYKYGRS